MGVLMTYSVFNVARKALSAKQVLENLNTANLCLGKKDGLLKLIFLTIFDSFQRKTLMAN